MERILYAPDLAPHSDRALQRAKMLAVQHNAELLTFHATDKSGVDVKRQISELDDQIVKTQLPGAVLGGRSLTNYDVMVVSGNPIDELVAVTPADVYFGRDKAILQQRERIKQKTLETRRLHHRQRAA